MSLQSERALIHLSAQYAIAHALARATSLEEATRKLLAALGETLAFDFGALWQLNLERNELHCVDTWQVDGVDCAVFDEVTRDNAFAPGVGLPGRVIEAAEPLWIPNIEHDRKFSRAAEALACDLRGGFCFPLATRGVLQGAIEFYTAEPTEPDPELLELLTASGSQIAEFIERVRAEAAVMDSEAIKSSILEAALDCIVTMDADGAIVDFNRAAEEIFGYRREDVLGQQMGDLIIPPSLRERHREGLERYLETGEERAIGRRLELVGMRSDGSEFPIELTITQLATLDGPPVFAGFIRDLTNLKSIEAELAFHSDLMEALDASSLEARLVIAQDLRILGFNRQFSELWNIPPEAMEGKTNAEALAIALEQVVNPERFVPPPDQLIEQLDSQVIEEIELKDGRTLERYGALLGSREAPAGRIWFFRDISKRKRQEIADRFLAEAGKLLSASLEIDATLRSVAATAVPLVADWCVIDRIEDGELHRVAIAHADPVKERLGKEFERLHPSTLDGDGGVATVASTGESMLVPAITREMLDEGARNDEHRVLLHELGFHSAMVVPIRAGGEILGALSFATAESRRSLDETDLALAEELARRVASTMQNARLFAERALIADTLQRGLLPPDLPKIPGVVLSARFRPVGHGVVIGGDFYDVFELGEDTWGFVIGDVCGKGPAAAGLTALVRYTLRAVAGGPGDLTDTLRLVNSAIIRQHGDGQFCTAAYGVLRRDEDGFDLELAVAGHPQPLLVRDGECQGLGEPGLLLGVHPDPELNVTRIRMVDKDTLILYTDGLTEAHAPQRIIEDEELCRAAAAAAERSPTEIARALEERLVGEPTRSARDDIAILSITVV